MSGPGASPSQIARADVVVVGAGAAGLYTALTAAEAGARVRLVSRSPLAQSASYWAQGGLAAALAENDSPGLHLADTLTAGRGAVRERVARILCEEAPARVHELERRGVAFDRSPSEGLMLSLEGGHTRRRIVHAEGSATGRHLTATLSSLVAAESMIDVHERCAATGLWVDDGRCSGVLTDAGPIRSAATILATGGAAALWLRTSNPRGAVGAGLVLALDAGAALADMEFMQFHPTALAADGEMDGFLITEAVRGDGALLLDGAGERFIDELAPRDEVARAIDAHLRSGGSVALDMRMIGAERFPNITAGLARAGLDPARDLIPVAPAAHYMIGGVATDEHGHSTVPGLFAVGECASNGVHGANRLASNSLSECFVFGRRAGLAALDEPPPAGGAEPPNAPGVPIPTAETRAALWEDAGLVRSAEGLERLAANPNPLAALIARAALERRESRGCHLRADFPETDPDLDGSHLLVSSGTAPSLQLWE